MQGILQLHLEVLISIEEGQTQHGVEVSIEKIIFRLVWMKIAKNLYQKLKNCLDLFEQSFKPKKMGLICSEIRVSPGIRVACKMQSCNFEAFGYKASKSNRKKFLNLCRGDERRDSNRFQTGFKSRRIGAKIMNKKIQFRLVVFLFFFHFWKKVFDFFQRLCYGCSA